MGTVIFVLKVHSYYSFKMFAENFQVLLNDILFVGFFEYWMIDLNLLENCTAWILKRNKHFISKSFPFFEKVQTLYIYKAKFVASMIFMWLQLDSNPEPLSS